DKPWTTRAVRDGHPMETYPARELFREIAEAAWLCGDPGLQFDTTVNGWHTCPNTARINASNPCSEYMFLDDSACNLASLNLMHFRTIDGEFDTEAFKHAVDIVLLAQEILVDYSKYPTQKIAENSYAYRPLGLGYANLGALLMASGLPYDSQPGRNFAAAITALMHGQANLQSSRIAERMGPFAGYARNAEPMLGVMRRHRKAAYQIPEEGVAENLRKASREVWDAVLTSGEENGFRNGQVTVLAPTGTIGFMMDCDTTGIEPDIALIKYKKLVGGGMLKIVNNTVPLALQKLGYTQPEVQDIVAHLDKNETIEEAPHLKDEHLPVFDCAFKPAKGTRSIHWMGHIQMMGAVQPFLSGAISKTVNMPTEATPEEIEKAYLEAWRQGLKAIAVYRDGCKRSQPLNTSRASSEKEKEPAVVQTMEYRTERRHLPDERQSITHKFSIGGHEGYLTVGMYEDGTPGELFVVMAKEGSVVSGLMDSFATAISLSLQYGVPLKVLVDKFSHTRFEPSGFTGNPNIPIAKSITDYIFRWLSLKFLPSDELPEGLKQELAALPAEGRPAPKATTAEKPATSKATATWLNQQDAPPCHTCGAIMVRSGACYKCSNCGATSGCS
ncbi:MAG TPA: vitamin B12-dependent ribonucleotide reductase, partial [Myxococcaceae bacterium]|nr:vitamin B12-dependent ribonucleotide reductase [Myxococcaceae bacterium]